MLYVYIPITITCSEYLNSIGMGDYPYPQPVFEALQYSY